MTAQADRALDHEPRTPTRPNRSTLRRTLFPSVLAGATIALVVPWFWWAPEILWLAAPCGVLAAAGVAAGVTLLADGYPVLGSIGATNWAVPIVGHFVSMAAFREWWAPTMPGDVLGLLASIVMSAVALTAVIRHRVRRHNATRNAVAVGVLLVLTVAATGCGDPPPAALSAPSSLATIPLTAAPETTPVPSTTTSIVEVTATTAPAPAPDAIRFRPEWRGDQLKMIFPNGFEGRSLGPIICFGRVLDECTWHAAFAAERIRSGVAEGFDGAFLLLYRISLDHYEIAAEVPLSLTDGIPVFRDRLDGSGHLIVFSWSEGGPVESAAWEIAAGSIASVGDPGGLAIPIGLEAVRVVGGGENGAARIDISGPHPATLKVRDAGGAMLDGTRSLMLLTESPPGGTEVVSEVWLGESLGWAPDGSAVWRLLDEVAVPPGVGALSWPGECAAGGAVALVSIERRACDTCVPDDGWGVAVVEDSLMPVVAGTADCTCVCEG